MFTLLNDSDILKQEHFFIKDFLNNRSSKQFKWILRNLSKGIGCGFDDAMGGFHFWDNLDEYNRTFYKCNFNGIEVYYFDDELVFEYAHLYHYFTVASENYIKQMPNEQDEIEQYIRDLTNYWTKHKYIAK